MNTPGDDHLETTAQGCAPRVARRDIDLYVWSEVSRIHENWLGREVSASTPARRHARVDAEAADLTARIRAAEATLLAELRATWRDLHGTQLPTPETVARLRRTAREDARHAVPCAHLYSRVPAELIAERRGAEYTAAEQRLFAAVFTDLQRWRRRAVRPTALTRSIVVRTWGTVRSTEFLVLAHALIQARIEDGLPLPVTPLDPLAAALAETIRDQLVADGLLPV